MSHVPDIPQTFSEKTLKGFLLSTVDHNATNPAIIQLNKRIIARVDQFWDDIVVPLQRLGAFNGNKIVWYFNIYKEGLESKKVRECPFTFVTLTADDIQKIVMTFDGKDLDYYLNLSVSYLANVLSVLTNWQRDQMLQKRAATIYNTPAPAQWIVNAEAQENGLMSEKGDPNIDNIIKNIQLIMSRRW